ncbi:unnamed protein product [Meloidogyne enterolobii]|uniref:Uncharacterized protein n=1 Tax=Meloidogyne enterolobii TaxID=390850 RepID=A0ACB0Y8U7_MELEN
MPIWRQKPLKQKTKAKSFFLLLKYFPQFFLLFLANKSSQHFSFTFLSLLISTPAGVEKQRGNSWAFHNIRMLGGTFRTLSLHLIEKS